MTANSCAGMALAVLVLTAASARAGEITHTSEPLAQVKAKVEAKKAILVDVREKSEWDKGHIQGAVLVPLSVLMKWDGDELKPAEREKLTKALPKGSVVYCHCAAGGRALLGGETLRKLGYEARPLRPGYKDLIDAGFPRASGK